EVTIETEGHPGVPVTIWIVVLDGTVFVRSVKGPKGRWYRDLSGGSSGKLGFDGTAVAVRAVPVTDDEVIAEVSEAYLEKYRPSPWADAMVRPEVLGTTLRLEPV
ncbi:MAG: DUF2255 family protein, partial [Alphaproteobacteria bacterium]|nr:DUF2255 family protein [Alphaproteobacteria bacterium]